MTDNELHIFLEVIIEKFGFSLCSYELVWKLAERLPKYSEIIMTIYSSLRNNLGGEIMKLEDQVCSLELAKRLKEL